VGAASFDRRLGGSWDPFIGAEAREAASPGR
jgi:hypothetical protein